MSELQTKVSCAEFLSELQKECRHLQKGGSSYRMATAELSLHLVSQINDIVPFLDRNSAKETVSMYFPSLDQDRRNDMAKFLFFIATDVHRGTSYFPDDVKEYLHQKRQQRKPLSFVLR